MKSQTGFSEALLTDFYELTMLATYFELGMDDTAVFEFFIRRLPEQRNFLLAAGLEQALVYLENLHFSPAELEWLENSGHFRANFVDWLANFRFTGDVQAMSEGSVFFANEPILRLTAPMAEAQLVESRLINILHFQTMIASKAVRSVLAAPGKMLVDFGFRRAHGAEAGVLGSRASYLAGFTGTATVKAGQRFGIPVFGTMAHSFVQAHDKEAEAFRNFARSHPHNTVLLIDTYSTPTGAKIVAQLAPVLAAEGIRIKAVRIDSGDLAAHAHAVRAILDKGCCEEIGIFASGGLDEYQLTSMLAGNAPIDGFGIGTALDTSSDAPSLDCAYKLQEYAGRPRRKRSEGKATWPGRKQVFRHYSGTGRMRQDVLALEDEDLDGEPLLKPVMKKGQRLVTAPTLVEIRSLTAAQLNRLPEALTRLDLGPEYPVQVSPELKALAATVDAQYG